jgi:hypothetical protein
MVLITGDGPRQLSASDILSVRRTEIVGEHVLMTVYLLNGERVSGVMDQSELRENTPPRAEAAQAKHDGCLRPPAPMSFCMSSGSDAHFGTAILYSRFLGRNAHVLARAICFRPSPAHLLRHL